jgi:Saxitoxin biosynthesis operon protein SxtJ
MKWQPKHTSLVVIAIGFAVLYFIFRKNWLLIPIAVCLIGFILGPVGDFIHFTWMQLAKLLGYINSRILLSVIFFVFLTPIALLMRLLGKTQFVKKTGVRQSLFVTRNHLYKSQDLQNPF